MREKDKLGKEIEELKKNKTGIQDYFVSSPYDPTLNMDGYMTELIFNEKLRVIDNLEEYHDVFDSKLSSYQSDSRVVFLTGFSGVGKSTFIKYFESKTRDSYDHVIIDFNEVLRDHEEPEESDNKTEPEYLLELIQQYLLSHDLEKIEKTAHFILYNQAHFFQKKWISKDFNRVLPEFRDAPDVQSIQDFIGDFGYYDAFTFFFVLLFIGDDTDEQGEKVIIYFDNLDKVELEYLTNEFIKNFEIAQERANRMAQDKLFADYNIRFNGRFRFVFCLRDANSILLNQHIADRIKVLELPLRLDPGHCKEVFEKRTEFLEEIYSEMELSGAGYSGQEFQKYVDLFIGDPYFKNAIIPLLNCDYRKLASAVLEFVDKIAENNIFFKSDRRLEYGARGFLLFHLIKRLEDIDFIKDYKQQTLPDARLGYCYIDRMVLTVLMHYSRYTTTSLSKPDKNGTCKLYSECIRHLTVMYDFDTILESITRLFVCHEQNWVHLISIYNKKLFSVDDFHGERLLLKELYEIQLKIDKGEKNQLLLENRKGEIINSLDKIRLKVNPSGFAYVKYVLPHFEFYSVISNNNEPLYENFYVTKISLGQVVNYDLKIEQVLARVENHMNYMEKFYRNKLCEIVAIEKFYSSKYCFRLIGDGSRPKKGFFHGTRMVTSMVDYLDRFRRRVLAEENVFINKDNFNKKMIHHISRLLKLLDQSPDLRAKKNLLPTFRNRIKIIQKSQFEDFQTTIDVPEDLDIHD